jgi:hypothetical protein
MRPLEFLVGGYVAPDGNTILFPTDGSPADEASIAHADSNCWHTHDVTSCAFSRAWGYDERLKSAQDALKSELAHIALQTCGVAGLASGGGALVGAGCLGLDAGLNVYEGNTLGAVLDVAALSAVGLSKAYSYMREAAQGGEVAGPTGEGTTFTHWGNAESLQGITGISADALEEGVGVPVRALTFGTGSNEYLSQAPGDIFATPLGAESSGLKLANIGIPADKQQFAIQFSQEAAFANNVRPAFAANNPSLSPAARS